jgi:hypothetical protein
MAEYFYNQTEPRDYPAPFASDRLPYRAVVPAGWGILELSTDGTQFDVFSSEESQQGISVVFFTLTLPGVYEDTEQTFLEGKRIEASESINVGGRDGRLWRWSEHHLFGKDKRGLHVTFVDGVFTWQISMESEKGAPGEALFHDFLDSFTPSEVLLGDDDPSGNIWALQPGDCFHSLPLPVEPRQVTEFLGSVDGFRKVASRDEPHTGMIITTFSDIPKGFDFDSDDPAMGAVLCRPMPGRDHPPDGVAGVLVLAHAAGPYTGPYEEGGEPPSAP